MSKRDLNTVPGFSEAVRDIMLHAGSRPDRSITREVGRSVMQTNHLKASYMRWVYKAAGEKLGQKITILGYPPSRMARANGGHPARSLKLLADSSEIKEILLLQHQHEKLLREREGVSLQIDELQLKLKELDSKLSAYKPVQAALESIRTAKQRVSDELFRMSNGVKA
jgi:hypothetical protein